MALLDNKDVYSTVEFDFWAQRERLLPEEEFVIRQYLNPGLKTLEAGTAGGRIVLEMQRMGFSDLRGFDFVPSFIEQARRRDTSGSIYFDVQDARRLDYPDASFDQILYLQQILNLIEDEQDRLAALGEARRILAPGGTALFSFLSYEARRASPMYAMLLVYIRLLRALGRFCRSPQLLPWLRLGGRFNWAALLDRGPHVYWYRAEEIETLLRQAGFEIIGLGTNRQIAERLLCSSASELYAKGLRGVLYCVCRKPDDRPVTSSDQPTQPAPTKGRR